LMLDIVLLFSLLCSFNFVYDIGIFFSSFINSILIVVIYLITILLIVICQKNKIFNKINRFEFP